MELNMEKYHDDIEFRLEKLKEEYRKMLWKSASDDSEYYDDFADLNKHEEIEDKIDAISSLLEKPLANVELTKREIELVWECVLWTRRYKKNPQEFEKEHKSNPEREQISIDYENGLVYFGDDVYTAEEIDALGWEADHFRGTKLNVDAISRNKKVVELLDKLKDGQFSGTIVKDSPKINERHLVHQIYFKSIVSFGEECDDIKTFAEILQNIDEFSVVAILHDEDTATDELAQNNNVVINLAIENIWDEHKLK